ncbi:DUF2785 domain-containing protein [Bacillus sp. 196mf]|uniref:DUF2785 domain-containing protein n=1 Tax=Bacillus sp. 196mf TaxID=1761754 RepID=UPI000D7C9BE1|nr:DUF2785 domain-containing protein [Bacillus sp. 196mf]
MDRMELQQGLEQLQQNDYMQIQHIDLQELTLQMLQHIGTPDRYMREMLLYKCFAYIIQKGFLPIEHIKVLATTCLHDDFLYLDITQPGTDSVFTRSYTALLMALIIQFDHTHVSLSDEMLYKIKDAFIQYMNVETDYRSYIPDKGWAHAIAHGADALHAIALHPKMMGHYEEEIIHCLVNKIFIHDNIYHYYEEERIATPLLAMIHHGFSSDRFISLVDKKIQRLPQIKKKLSLPEYFALCANVKNFIRTLFFKVREHPQYHSFLLQIEKIIKEFAQYDQSV